MIVDIIFVVIGAIEWVMVQLFSVIDRLSTSLFPSLVSWSNNASDSLGDVVGYVWLVNGIIPVAAFVQVLSFLLAVWFLKYLLKWAIALFNMTPWFKIHIPKGATMKHGDR